MIIFHNDNDYYQWEKQRLSVSLMNDIDEDIRQRLIEAYHILESELGKGFLKISTINHPIRQKISDKTRGQMLELIEFTKTMQRLKAEDSNYPFIVNKLVSKNKSKTEGVPFIDIAQTFLKENFKVWFIEEIKGKKGIKTPDMKITNSDNQDSFYIEVTTMDESGVVANISDNYKFLHREFTSGPVFFTFYAIQRELFTKEEYPEIKKIIVNAKNDVRQKNQIITYSDKRFEFMIAPINFSGELQKICNDISIKSHDVQGLFWPKNNDTSRIISDKIGKKTDQIPADSNGLIYIEISPIYFMSIDWMSCMLRFEKSMANYKQLFGIVIYSKIGTYVESKVVKTGKHIFATKAIENFCYETRFVHNKNCHVTISASTIKKIYKTFI